jgi:hypothetical protein
MMSNKATSYSIIAFATFCLVSSLFLFPAFAANKTSSFIEFNIAFVLGVSLPVLLTTFIVKPSSAARKRYPILLTLVLLTLLCSFNYLSQRSGLYYVNV